MSAAGQVEAGAFGLYAHGSMLGLTSLTYRHPQVCKFLNRYLRALAPDDTWTSFFVNKNGQVAVHQDNHNRQLSLNLTISLGSFTGGELWLELEPNQAVPPAQAVRRRMPNGQFRLGQLLSTHQQLIRFNPKLMHAVQPWTGERISISAYTSRSLDQADDAMKKHMRCLLFPLPPNRRTVAAASPSCSDVHSCETHRFAAAEHPASTAALYTPAHASRLAIVIEELPAVSLVLQDAGWTVEHLHHNQVNSSATSELARRLKEGRIHAVWSDMPLPGRHVPRCRLSAHMTQLCLWMQLCGELGCVACLFGAYGSQWLNPSVADLIGRGQLVKSYHRACALGLRLDVQQKAPSSTCFVSASTGVVLPGHPCRCPEAQNAHVLDWTSSKLPHQRRLRGRLHSAVATAVAQQWVQGSELGDSRLGDSTPGAMQAAQPADLNAQAPGPTALEPGQTPLRQSTPDSQPNCNASAAAAYGSSRLPPSRLDLGVGSQPPHLHAVHAAADSSISVPSFYPTEERLRQKQRLKDMKDRGETPKIRKMIVEDHHDDCGTCLDSLMPLLPSDYPEEQAHSAHFTLLKCTDPFPLDWLVGSQAKASLPKTSPRCHLAANAQQGVETVMQWPSGAEDICVYSGGAHGLAYWAVRRHYSSGTCLDMLVQVDPSDQPSAACLLHYVYQQKPLLFIMSPSSGIHASPTATALAGRIAFAQHESGRYFACEQAWPTQLPTVAPWPQVLAQPGVLSQNAALPVASPSPADQLAVTLWANHAPLLQLHRNTSIPPAKLRDAQGWPWWFATRVSDGACLVRCHHQLISRNALQLYPSVGVGEPSDATEDPPGQEFWRKCPGCRGKQAKYDSRHNRIPGQCKYPDEEQIDWSCPGCKAHRPRTHSTHTYDEHCRYAIVEERRGHPRAGRHPRPPARKAREDPTTDLQAQLPEGQGDLAAGEEAEAKLPSSTPHTSPDGVNPPDLDDDNLFPELDLPQLSPAEKAAGAASDARARSSLEPPAEDSTQPRRRREQRTTKEQGSGQETPSDWSRYDVSRSLRVLRVGSDNAVRLELRKLHLRLWHASRQSMTQILRAAGVSNRVIEMIPDIINTCRECRKWARPGPNTQHALTASLRFNQHVEVDLLFYRTHIVLHLICRATRWHGGCVVQSKQGEELFEALQTAWIGIHGPMESLVSDGESGLWKEEIAGRLKRQGVILKPRAPQQHARFIERRGAVLRVTMHVMQEQLDREGLVYTFPSLLAEAIFAGNALTHVGGSTPYQAVYGRQPAMLPALDAPDHQDHESISAAGDRQRASIRHAALQAMIQATSLARLNRAAHTRTSPDSTREYQAEDLVDVYRKPTSKDASGWAGPYRVVRSEPGQVVVKVNGVERPYRSQDTRHALLMLHAENQTTSWEECFRVVQAALLELKEGQSALYLLSDSPSGAPSLSQAARSRPQVLHALDHIFTSCWRLGETSGARLARGAKHLSVVPAASHSTVVWWFRDIDVDVRFSSLDHTKVDLSSLIGPEYPRAFVVQALHTTDQDVTLADVCDEAAAITHETLDRDMQPDSDHERTSIHTPQGPLSAITEEATDEPEELPEAELSTFLASCSDCPEAVQDTMVQIFQLSQSELLEEAEALKHVGPLVYVDPSPLPEAAVEDPACHYHLAGINPAPYGELENWDDAGNGYVELWFTREFSKVIGDENLLRDQETYVMQVFASGFRNAVIKRESDLLTTQELQEHAAAVRAASVEELRIWDKYNCFKRVPRATAHNIMDSKAVVKWKVTTTPSGQTSRIPRARLALRGFKDLQANDIEAHASTASRLSQRMLCSEVACRPSWKFVTVDVNKAFLQGMSYDEIHKLTGETEREVHFTLPHGWEHHLRKISGYEDFCPRTEVLKCLKPGTGCKDAPRAFSLKLATFTRSEKIGLRPSTYDPELELKVTATGILVLLLVKHVDDLKIAGEAPEVDALISYLESGFGKLSYQEGTFTNCGLQHIRMPDGSVQMNQNEYINAMRPIHHPELAGRRSDEPCTAEVHSLFQSLLGAVAYCLLSQSWAAVFVVALQRRTTNPLNLHVRRLNLLVKALQKQKSSLVFPAMTCKQHVLVYSDASFDKETENKGYGMRGTVFLRMGARNGQPCCHLLEAQSQSLKLVTRSTFASETLAAVGAIDNLTPLLLTFEEFTKGALSPARARQLREVGGFAFSSELCIDAMNLFYALTAVYPRLPAEKTLFVHISWLRDMFQRGVPRTVSWSDTRDMVADGLTKGKVDRTALLEAMRGVLHVRHPKKFP